VSIAAANTKFEEAVDAIEDGDWELAEKKLLAASALLAALPSRSAHDGEEVEFDARSVDTLLAHVRAKTAARLGVRNTKVTYVNTPPDDE
jgi:hypothetical protein